MHLDEMTPDSSAQELIQEMTQLIADLQSGKIIKEQAIQQMVDIRADLDVRKIMLDPTGPEVVSFVQVELIMKMVIKFINNQP